MEKALSVIAVAGVVWWNMGGAIWDSWSHHYARIQAENARVEEIRKDGYESAFAVVCPDYFEAGWLDRQLGYRHLSWCKGFKDRL